MEGKKHTTTNKKFKLTLRSTRVHQIKEINKPWPRRKEGKVFHITWTRVKDDWKMKQIKQPNTTRILFWGKTHLPANNDEMKRIKEPDTIRILFQERIRSSSLAWINETKCLALLLLLKSYRMTKMMMMTSLFSPKRGLVKIPCQTLSSKTTTPGVQILRVLDFSDLKYHPLVILEIR